MVMQSLLFLRAVMTEIIFQETDVVILVVQSR